MVYKSKCCGVDTYVTSFNYICSKCHNPCLVYPVENCISCEYFSTGHGLPICRGCDKNHSCFKLKLTQTEKEIQEGF